MYKLLVLLLLSSAHFYSAWATHINVSVGPDVERLFLASYYADRVLLVDSVDVVDNEARFVYDNSLHEGMYFLSDQTKKQRFDFLLGTDQDLEIILPTFSPFDVEVVGAVESYYFHQYQKVAAQGNFDANMKAVKDILPKLVDHSFCSLVLHALLPSPKKTASRSLLVVDNSDIYEYNVSHFWDYFKLKDERLVYTPFFAPQVKAFLRNVVMPRQDYLYKEAVWLLEAVEYSTPLLQIVASESLSIAVEDKIMGIDALGYEVITRYYLSGRLGDLPPKQVAMLNDYVLHTRNCRIGHVAQEIRLSNWQQEEGEVSLFDSEAIYTLVLFWEPDCEYCKVVLPTLRDEIYAKYADKGLHVYAVNTQQDYSLWRNYILDNELYDWDHGYSPNGSDSFMENYGVRGTPFMYILDVDKRIIAKNVKIEFLNTMLSRLFSMGTIY